MDKERYLIKIHRLQKNLDDLVYYLPDSENNYLKFPIRKLAIERLLQISIEIVLDLCAMLIADWHLGPPEDEDQILNLLNDKLPCMENIKEMKRFRNILVHKYGEIDDKIVFQHVQENLKDFHIFIKELRKFIE